MAHTSKPSMSLAKRAKRCAGTSHSSCPNIGTVRIAGVWYCRWCIEKITEEERP